MNEIDRLELCISIAKVNRKNLREKVEMSLDRFRKTMKQEIRMSHLEFIALAKEFPDHKHWIVFGEELPESNQISPMTKIINKGK